MSEGTGRILVVDDEPGMREGCRWILESEGHRVTTAESGEQALGLFSKGAFDLALLDLSRLQHLAKVALTLAPVRLEPLLQEAVSFAAQPAKARNVTITLEAAFDLPYVDADREEMLRLFTNLVDNAVKYNREGGSVLVAARQARAAPGYVAVEVTDTGVGMPQGAIARLGEAFYRVRTAATMQITGTGLGLSICRQIIEAHHGQLEVESEEGKGSTFRVLLPRTQRPAGA